MVTNLTWLITANSSGKNPSDSTAAACLFHGNQLRKRTFPLLLRPLPAPLRGEAEGERGSQDWVLLCQGCERQEHSEWGLTRWGERRRWLFTTGAGMLPGDEWRWESLIVSCSHAGLGSSLPPSCLPEDPCELPVQKGNYIGFSEHFLFAWLMRPSRRGCKREAGGNFGTVFLPSEGGGMCFKGFSKK